MKKRILIMVVALLMAVFIVTPVLAVGGGDVNIVVDDPVIDTEGVQGETAQVSGGASVNYDLWSATWARADYVTVGWFYNYSITAPSGEVVASDTWSNSITNKEVPLTLGDGITLTGSQSYNWSEDVYLYESGDYTVNQNGEITGEWGDGKWKWVWDSPRLGHWVGTNFIERGSLVEPVSGTLKKYIEPEKPNHLEMPEWYPTFNQFGLLFGGMSVYNFGDGNTLPTIEKISKIGSGDTAIKAKVNILGGTKVNGGNILHIFINDSGNIVIASTNGKTIKFSNPITISVEIGGDWFTVGEYTDILVVNTPIPKPPLT